MPRCPRCGSKELEIKKEGTVEWATCKWCGKLFPINKFDPENLG